MAARKSEPGIREAVGVFFDSEHLKETINELQAVGFSRDELGLLASEYAVQESLGDLYIRTNQDEDSAQAPELAFVEMEADEQQKQSVGGGLAFVGTSGVVGAVVASSAFLGGALVAALSGVLAVGAVGAAAAAVINQSDAEYLQQHVDEGHILLFVRISDAAREDEVLDILRRHAGIDVKMYEIPKQELSDRP